MKYFLAFLFSIIMFTAYSQADYILYKGKIFTADKEMLWAEAIAIKGERILAVGKNDDILKLKDAATKLIDLKGQLLVPGFNDAHAHVGAIYPAYRFTVTDDPVGATPWALIKDSIAKIVKEIQPGTFIITNIHPELLEDINVRRRALDSIAPQNPVMLSAWTGHGKIMNSAALQFFGYNEASAFLGGRIDKNQDQQLTGLTEEYANYRVGAVFADKLERSKIIRDLEVFYKQAAALGITSVQNMCTQHFVQQATDIYSNEEFPCRVRLIAFPFTSSYELLLNEWNGSFHQLNKLNYVSGVKLIMDGTPVERLTCLKQPYNDKANEFGRLNFNEAQLKQYMEYCLAQKQQIIIHAGGDSTIATIIRIMRSLHPDPFWKDKRTRIEHGEMAVMQPGDINTLKQLGIVIVQNPTHLALPEIMTKRFGEERMKHIQPMRTLIDNDIPLAIGGDGPINPYLNIMLATIHPDNPKEAITREEAVIVYTYGSAYAEFKEKEKGTLAEGKLADFAVLSQDIFTVDADKLPATESVLTFVGGKIVYNKNVLR